MGESIVLIAQIWIHPGKLKAFLEFERQAARIMAKHGGRIERVVRPLEPMSEEVPHEVHIVTFPSSEAWETYKTDPDIVARADERIAAISRSSIIIGNDLAPYGL